MNYRYDADTKIHYIDDKALFLPVHKVYMLIDYKKDGKYALENIKENKNFI